MVLSHLEIAALSVNTAALEADKAQGEFAPLHPPLPPSRREDISVFVSMALGNRAVVIAQVAAVVWTASWFSCSGSSAYELQDTIHALKEENVHLHQRLENLTRALRDLKHFLDRSRDTTEEHDTEALNAWNDWTEHGLSSETHHLLEQTFCRPEVHGAAGSAYGAPALLFLLTPVVLLNLPLF